MLSELFHVRIMRSSCLVGYRDRERVSVGVYRKYRSGKVLGPMDTAEKISAVGIGSHKVLSV